MTTDTLPFRHGISSRIDARIRRIFRWLADGEPKPLIGWSGRLQVGQYGQLVDVFPDFVTVGDVDGLVILDVPPGTFTRVGVYWYVLDLMDPDSEPVPFVNGNLRILSVFP